MDQTTGKKRAASDSLGDANNKRSRANDAGHGDHPASPGVPKPHPFFFYTDFSQEEDDDPLTPLTPLARVPNFPAKMHAILARKELAEIISWLPHGRAWKIFKPREFEIKVLPTYFNHGKLSSFIRQANGWGFRRISHGVDKNSYYHELFLRGMPHLCKKMRRPGVAEKNHLRPEYEPDLYEISKLHPVPLKHISGDDSILLNFTVSEGPKARVPVDLFARSKNNVDSTKGASPHTVHVEESQSDTNEANNFTHPSVGSSCQLDKAIDTGKLPLCGNSTNNSLPPENSLLVETQVRINNGTLEDLYPSRREPNEMERQLLPHLQQTGVFVGVPMYSLTESLHRNYLFKVLQSYTMAAAGQTKMEAVPFASSCLNEVVAHPATIPSSISAIEQILANELLHFAAQNEKVRLSNV